jgi:hypothetical protein
VSQGWVDQHPVLFSVFVIPFCMLAVSLAMSLWSGWALLALKFRARNKFTGSRRWNQSGQMRWMAGYRGVLIVGANSEGLYLATLPFFPCFHPALFIPWAEIQVTSRNPLVFAGVDFELGNDLHLPLYLYGSAVDDVRKNAGTAWPGARSFA